MRLARIRSEVRSQRYGIAMGALALLVALGAPAQALEGATSAANTVTKALKLAKKADKRSKKALKLAKRVSGKPGPQGAKGDQGIQGPAGADGSPDTPAQVLSKLSTVGGAGSGLDADLLDGQQASAFVADADTAGGDLSGPFSNLQLNSSSVGAAEIATGAVGSSALSGGAVTAAALGSRIATSSAGVVIPGGTGQNGAYNTATQAVTCPAGMKVLGGGAVWTPPPPAGEELFIQESGYSGFPTETWFATGGNDSGTDYTFKAWAICLRG